MCKYSLLLCCSILSAVSGGALSEYSITPSSEVAYYHYPAPNRAQQLQEPPGYQPASAAALSASLRYAQLPPLPQQQQQQQHAAAPRTYQHQAPRVQYQAQQQSHQQQQPQLQQQPQQPQYRHYQLPTQSQQPQQQQATTHPVPVAKQFASPALENAAFTQALNSQGYNFGAASAAATTSMIARSLNVKLPVPFGITPINIAPLPLQAGAPYDSISRDVTSYGTAHPQRRR